MRRMSDRVDRAGGDGSGKLHLLHPVVHRVEVAELHRSPDRWMVLLVLVAGYVELEKVGTGAPASTTIFE